jgi:dihydroorotate dehydrogenase (NAD+) catalytic subunit
MIDLAPNNPYSLELATPVVAAAGILGYGVEVARQLGLAQRGAAHGLGAIVTRTTTPRARRARPLPALHEAPAGLIYTGLAHNPGLRAVRERFAPAWASWELPVILSVAAESAPELADALADLEMVEGVRGVELALGPMGAATPADVTRLVGAARAATPLPLLARLPGHAPDLVAVAQAAAAAGADALSLIDGLPARIPGGAEGLLCGPALRPLALRAVAAVCAAVELPVVGGGGVAGPADARALLESGAAAVALGSALVVDLRAAARVAAGIADSR